MLGLSNLFRVKTFFIAYLMKVQNLISKYHFFRFGLFFPATYRYRPMLTSGTNSLLVSIDLQPKMTDNKRNNIIL